MGGKGTSKGKILYEGVPVSFHQYHYTSLFLFIFGIVALISGILLFPFLDVCKHLVVISFGSFILSLIYYIIRWKESERIIRIFENGIETRLVKPYGDPFKERRGGTIVGRKFVDFDSVYSIHPILHKSPEMLGGVYFGLRFVVLKENFLPPDKNNCLISDIFHLEKIDITDIIPILKKHLGNKWQAVFKRNLPILFPSNIEIRLFEEMWTNLEKKIPGGYIIKNEK